ncbi:MAG: hypothetical protein PHT54_01350 [Candidatus Nanoarchaeia archaeon]|nr:hypothetical protein [Candidatus Nanoarchaeia archaeon]
MDEYVNLVGIFVQGEILPPNLDNSFFIYKEGTYRGILNSKQGERVLFEISGKISVLESYNIILEPGCTLYLKGYTNKKLFREGNPQDPIFYVKDVVKVRPAGLEEEVDEGYETQLEEPTKYEPPSEESALENKYLGENYTPKLPRRRNTLF